MRRGPKPKPRTTPVGKRLFTLREEQDLTLETAAEKWEMNKDSLERYELGKDYIPSHVALRIADREKISLDWLFGRTDKRRVR